MSRGSQWELFSILPVLNLDDPFVSGDLARNLHPPHFIDLILAHNWIVSRFYKSRLYANNHPLDRIPHSACAFTSSCMCSRTSVLYPVIILGFKYLLILYQSRISTWISEYRRRHQRLRLTGGSFVTCVEKNKTASINSTKEKPEARQDW